jgi:hypothetical protein
MSWLATMARGDSQGLMPLHSPRSRTWGREAEEPVCAANNRMKGEDF